MGINMPNFKELQPGTTLNGGKYVIERKIGEGGFGITYKAVQQGLNRAVCVKEYFLAGRCVRNTQAKTVQLQGISEEKYEKFRQAFVKEAQTVASLHHPNIVEVIDIFDENNTSYMVMTFIEGRSLQSIVDAKGPLSYPDAVNYVAQISNAVDYIHKHSILHRDIKPENIMITADYKAILIDFGSAREFEQDKTQMHTTMLTHGYAPPEQYTANSRKGSYTDIYALGATFFFILTGRVPTEAAARLTEKMPEPKELNPDIPDAINRTILKAMQLKAENRYQTIREFMYDLQNLKPSGSDGSEDIEGKKKPDGVSATGVLRNKMWMWFFGLVFLVIILGAGIIFSVVRKSGPDPDEMAKVAAVYWQKSESCELFINNIVRDRDSNEGNKHFIIQALHGLQDIERMEHNPNFNEMEVKPVYEKLFADYQSNLHEAVSLVEKKYQRQVELGLDDNKYCDELRERLDLMLEILRQSEQGSALEIKLKPPKEK